MIKSMMPQNRRSKRSRQLNKARPHRSYDYSRAQADHLIGKKILEDMMERVENDNTIKGMGNGTNREKVSGKSSGTKNIIQGSRDFLHMNPCQSCIPHTFTCDFSSL